MLSIGFRFKIKYIQLFFFISFIFKWNELRFVFPFLFLCYALNDVLYYDIKFVCVYNANRYK